MSCDVRGVRSVWGAVGVIAVTVAVAISPQVAAASQRGSVSLHSRQTNVRLAAGVITISAALAKRELIGVSTQGVFKFRRAVGPLAKLRRGKVMLIKGRDAVKVAGVIHKHRQLLVKSAPATLTDVLRSGKLTFSGTPDLRTGILVGPNGAPASHQSVDVVQPAWLPRARAAAAPVSTQGSIKGIDYSLSFTPASETRVEFEGTLCWAATSKCGSSPGLAAEIHLTGFLDTGPTDGSITVVNGHVEASDVSVRGLLANAKMTYTVTNKDGTEHNPPVVTLPLSYDVSVPGPGGIPLYMKLGFIVDMSFGMAKGSVENGGVVWNASGGLAALQQAGAKVTASASGASADTTILDQSNGGVPLSFAPTASGSAITIRMKWSAGLGVSSANAIAYLDWVEGLGQAVGSAAVGQLCSSYYSQFSMGTGLEAQIGPKILGLSLASQRKVLLQKVTRAEDPGCLPIGASG